MPCTRKLRRQRLRLWLADPHCYWCGVRTFLPTREGKSPKAPNEATIDHLRPRHHPERLVPARGGEVRRVLSCWKCNNERDQRESAQLPKEWFYEHGGTRPASERSVDELKRIEMLLLSRPPKSKRKIAKHYRNIVAIRDAIKAKESLCST